ncbi:2271_t:CDS:2 [Gigaspora margarita]|uniref:2271_t:CDS:1 n=1 Tax=Gigaspora margarita TaxID=4874 RepID=A0ABN7UUB0_GIGMA|nr:2271_t:CDS:2 [Gigaspora margarita]
MADEYQHVQKLIDNGKIQELEDSEEPKELIKSDDQKKRIFYTKRVILSELLDVKNSIKGVERLLLQLMTFQHENILNYYGLTYENERYYIVHDHANNGNLRSYIKGNQLSWDENLLLALQIVNGLKFLHDKLIIHSGLDPENILLHESTPKLANIGTATLDTRYSPPEYLDKRQINDRKKLNIYSLGVLLWEISSRGVEPFQNYDDDDSSLAVKIIDGVRKISKNGTPLKYVELYKKCWDGNHVKRPNCSEVLESLENISIYEVCNEKTDEKESYDYETLKYPLDQELTLNIDDLEATVERKRKFIDRFHLTKGFNRDKYLFVAAKKDILENYEDVGAVRLDFTPIVYRANRKTEPWQSLNKFNLYKTLGSQDPFDGADILRIQIPVGTLEYHCDPNKEFIQEIQDALNIPKIEEKRKRLIEIFNDYGNYVITKVTIGGAIMINCSEVSDIESIERLQAYLYWGISYAKGEAMPIFENGSLNDFPILRPSPPKKMENVKGLYTWLKGLYDCDDVALILYEDYKPSYDLLDEKLKQEVLDCFSLVLPNEPPPKLIPDLPDNFEEISFSKWISESSLLLVHMRDWIERFSLRYGVFLRRSNIGYGKKMAFKFLKEPKITSINQIYISLKHSQTKKEVYFLENDFNINKVDELKLNQIPFIDYASLNYPLENFQYSEKQPSSTIYCQIKYYAAEISFDIQSIIPSESYYEAVNTAIKSPQPYKELSEVFGNVYGHILPKSFIIGGSLKNSYDLDCPLEVNAIESQEIKVKENELDSLQDIINKNLSEWSEKYNIDTTLFISNDGKAIEKDKIKVWLNSLKDNPETWNIISYEDVVPAYKGVKQLREDFPADDDYQIYGNIAKKKFNDSGESCWEKISEVEVTFTHPNKYGLKKDETAVIWFVVGKIKGYCKHGFRDVEITCGTKDINSTQTEVIIETDAISTDYVLAISYAHKPIDNINVHYSINFDYWNENMIALEILKQDIQLEYSGHTSNEDLCESSDDEKENTNNELQEKITLNWCIINTNGKELMNDNKISPWNIYGNIISEEKKKEAKSSYYLPTYTPMRLEDAISQHIKPKGDKLDAWKTFIKLWNECGDATATYMIGFYLGNNILNAHKNFYNEILDGDSIEQATMRFYKESADCGNQYGQLQYAIELYHGSKVLSDKREAKKYFKLSAEQGNLDAMFNLGGLLFVDKNPKGKEWIIRAAKLGHEKSIQFCNKRNIIFK